MGSTLTSMPPGDVKVTTGGTGKHRQWLLTSLQSKHPVRVSDPSGRRRSTGDGQNLPRVEKDVHNVVPHVHTLLPHVSILITNLMWHDPCCVSVVCNLRLSRG